MSPITLRSVSLGLGVGTHEIQSKQDTHGSLQRLDEQSFIKIS